MFYNLKLASSILNKDDTFSKAIMIIWHLARGKPISVTSPVPTYRILVIKIPQKDHKQKLLKEYIMYKRKVVYTYFMISFGKMWLTFICAKTFLGKYHT